MANSCGFDGSANGKPESDHPYVKEFPVLWTILVVIVIVLAVIGLFTVMRGRA